MSEAVIGEEGKTRNQLSFKKKNRVITKDTLHLSNVSVHLTDRAASCENYPTKEVQKQGSCEGPQKKKGNRDQGQLSPEHPPVGEQGTSPRIVRSGGQRSSGGKSMQGPSG